MPEMMPVSRMKPRQMPTVLGLMSFTSSIFPLNNEAASSRKQNARARPMTNDTATINVDSAISFSEI